MAQEKEVVGTLLQHRIAQAKADIDAIDEKVASFQRESEVLLAQQVGLREVLAKLEK